MSLNRKLKKWTKADLISAEQAKAIFSHERKGIGAKYFRGLIGLSLLIIVAGIALMIASNWADISGGTKIICHFLLNAAIAYAVWRGKMTNHFWMREGATFILGGLNLTLIALIGQVYQLNGTLASASLLWLIISTPLFLSFGLSRLNAVAWTVGFITALGLNLHLQISNLNLASHQELALYLCGLAAVPNVLMLTGMIPKLKELRQEWHDTYLVTGAGLLIIAGLTSSILWYSDLDWISRELKTLSWVPLFICAFWAAIHMGARQFITSIAQNTRYRALCLIGAITAVFWLSSLIPGRGSSEIMSAVQFILYMGIIGYFSIPLGLNALVSASVVFITLRIFMLYIDLAGPMFFMGGGMIISGVILLLILWGALKIDTRIKLKLMAMQEDKS
tara:strand:+ start:251091 stop:252266 length:1176 start_codon:yes stop_codon:yes gene_type:complete